MRQVVTTLLTLALAAAAPAARARAVEPTTRTVYVTVIDKDGQPVPGLTPADFSVKEAGKDREVVAAVPATEKMRIALLVEETLASQGGVRQGIADFVKRMYQTAEISLIVIGQRNETAVDYTSDPNALMTGINNLTLSQAQRITAVPEGIYEISRVIEKNPSPRPVIVLLAIEKQQTSAEDPQNVLNQLAKSRAPMYVVSIEGGQSVSTDVGSLNDLAGRSQVMGDGPKQSGGLRVEANALTAFSKGLDQVANDLSSQYLLTYTLPDGTKPSNRLSVSLKKKGPTLRAPTKISDK